MRFKLTVDGKDHKVDASLDGSVTVDGEEFQADIERTKPDWRAVTVADRRYEVHLVEGSEEEGTFLLELAGERIEVSVSDVQLAAGPGAPPSRPSSRAPARRRKAPPRAKEGVNAPMPGKVVAVFVEVGEEVEPGDVVLILEAMKMENEIRATIKAIVSAVHVKPGDSVSGQQLLISYE